MTAGPELADGYVMLRESAELEGLRSSGGVALPVMYRMTGDPERDRMFVGEVVAGGKGAWVQQELLSGSVGVCREPRVAEVGQVVLLNLFNLSYRIHRGGKPYYLARYGALAGVVDRESKTVKPISFYVLLKPDPERARRSQLGDSRIVLPEPETTTTDDIGHGQGILASYGVVEAVGPGGWYDGHFEKPRVSVGDLVLFDGSHSTLDVQVGGVSRRLVASHQIIMSDPGA